MKVTLKAIRKTDPIFDPLTGINSQGVTVSKPLLNYDYEESVIDFLNHRDIPIAYKLHVVLNGGFINSQTLRLFSVWCVREGLKKIYKPDSRIINGCIFAEKYATWCATKEQLTTVMYSVVDARKKMAGSRYQTEYHVYSACYHLCDPDKIDAHHISDTIARTIAMSGENYASWEADVLTDLERAKQLRHLILMIVNSN